MESTPHVWPIRLLRSPLRLTLVAAMRAAIGLAALATARGATSLVGTALAVAGSVVLGYTILLALHLSSLRLEVHRDELWLRSVFGVRTFRLAPGAVTRRHLARSWRSPLEATIAGFGIQLGEGRLGTERLVAVIILGQSREVIMVPVVEGRVAVAAASEAQLLDALHASAPGIRSSVSALRPRRPVIKEDGEAVAASPSHMERKATW